MALGTTISLLLHVVFAGLWAGATAILAFAVLPLAEHGDFTKTGADAALKNYLRLARTSAVVMLLTGGHLLATRYQIADLVQPGRGMLVTAMMVLWLLLIGLAEAGAGIIRRDDAVAPRRGVRLLQAAAVVAVAVLAVGGALAV